jgi:hypothetical protein
VPFDTAFEIARKFPRTGSSQKDDSGLPLTVPLHFGGEPDVLRIVHPDRPLEEPAAPVETAVR